MNIQCMIVHLKVKFFYSNNFNLTTNIKNVPCAQNLYSKKKMKNISSAIPEINEVVILLVFGVIHKAKMSRVNARPTNLIE